MGLARYLSASSSCLLISSLRADDKTEISSLVMAWLPCFTVTVGRAATSGSDFFRCIAEVPSTLKVACWLSPAFMYRDSVRLGGAPKWGISCWTPLKRIWSSAGSLKSGEKLPPAPAPVAEPFPVGPWAGPPSRLRESSPVSGLLSLKLFSIGVRCLDAGRGGPTLSLLGSRDNCWRDPCREPRPKRSVDRSLLGSLL